MQLVQISDTHIVEDDVVTRGHFRTAERLRHAIAAINAMRPLPDLVLHTGDITDNGTPEEYTHAIQLLDELRCRWMVMPGNHDLRDPMRDAFPELRTATNGMSHLSYAIDDYPVRILCCDSVVPDLVDGELCPERLQWLSDRLAEAPDAPTVVALHHPPFATGMSWTAPSHLRAGGPELAELVAANPQVVRLIAGHVHRPISALFAGVLAVTAPALSYPFGLDLGPEQRFELTFEPPGMSVHVWYDDALQGQQKLITHTVPVGDWPQPIILRSAINAPGAQESS
ncbi:MAG: phosphodiesterase [Pseudomonadota bacterium]